MRLNRWGGKARSGHCWRSGSRAERAAAGPDRGELRAAPRRAARWASPPLLAELLALWAASRPPGRAPHQQTHEAAAAGRGRRWVLGAGVRPVPGTGGAWGVLGTAARAQLGRNSGATCAVFCLACGNSRVGCGGAGQRRNEEKPNALHRGAKGQRAHAHAGGVKVFHFRTGLAIAVFRQAEHDLAAQVQGGGAVLILALAAAGAVGVGPVK